MNLDERNEELEHNLEENPIDQSVATLVLDAKQRKKQLLLISILVALQFVVLALLAWGWKQNHDLVLASETNRNAIVARCESTNESRKRNAVLWDYVLAIPPNQPVTPERQKIIDDFVALKNKTFAPTDCSKVIRDSEPKEGR